MIKLNNMIMTYAQLNRFLNELRLSKNSDIETKNILQKIITQNSENELLLKKFLDLGSEVCYSEVIETIPYENAKDLKEPTYDLNSFCNVINVKKDTNEYNNLKSKMFNDRKIGKLGKVKSNGGGKCYYDFATLLNYTKTQLPQYHEIFKNSK